MENLPACSCHHGAPISSERLPSFNLSVAPQPGCNGLTGAVGFGAELVDSLIAGKPGWSEICAESGPRSHSGLATSCRPELVPC